MPGVPHAFRGDVRVGNDGEQLHREVLAERRQLFAVPVFLPTVHPPAPRTASPAKGGTAPRSRQAPTACPVPPAAHPVPPPPACNACPTSCWWGALALPSPSPARPSTGREPVLSAYLLTARLPAPPASTPTICLSPASASWAPPSCAGKGQWAPVAASASTRVETS